MKRALTQSAVESAKPEMKRVEIPDAKQIR
jgi:hypothetical protein